MVAFPLMYRTARGAFESFDMNLAYAGQTLGLSNTFIFWKIRMPACRQGILAGIVLAFARALGEYGATSMLIGYTPGKTATISTTVYQLWRTNDDAGAGYTAQVIAPIIADGEIIGGLILLSREAGAKMSFTDQKVAETTATIVGRQMGIMTFHRYLKSEVPSTLAAR